MPTGQGKGGKSKPNADGHKLKATATKEGRKKKKLAKQEKDAATPRSLTGA